MHIVMASFWGVNSNGQTFKRKDQSIQFKKACTKLLFYYFFLKDQSKSKIAAVELEVMYLS